MTQQDSGPGLSAADRERRTWWTIIAVGVVVFVGIIVLGWPLVEGRLAAARNLDSATATIVGTKEDLAAIDTAVRAEPATSTAAADARTLSVLEALRVRLEDAQKLSQIGYERLTTDEQKRAASVKAMAAARLEVLDAAEAVLSASSATADSAARTQAIEKYDAAVEKMRQADAALVRL